MRILTVCGSLQARSANLALLQAAAALAPAGVEVVAFDGLRDLPLFNPDLDGGDEPTAVTTWRRALAEAEALLIASPEYGHSLPGALKNGIDWVIGSGELHRKSVAITASVVDGRRGRSGLGALAQALGAVDAEIVSNEPVIRDSDSGAAIAGILRRLVEAAAARAS
jgi:chromate reductase, NAD(P)H dehydrogenase (quinone)